MLIYAKIGNVSECGCFVFKFARINYLFGIKFPFAVQPQSDFFVKVYMCKVKITRFFTFVRNTFCYCCDDIYTEDCRYYNNCIDDCNSKSFK